MSVGMLMRSWHQALKGCCLGASTFSGKLSAVVSGQKAQNKAQNVTFSSYQSAGGPTEIPENTGYHTPGRTVLDTRAEQFLDETKNSLLHLPGRRLQTRVTMSPSLRSRKHMPRLDPNCVGKCFPVTHQATIPSPATSPYSGGLQRQFPLP